MEQGMWTGALLEEGSVLKVVLEAIRSCDVATPDEIVESVSAQLCVPVGRVVAMVAGFESVAEYGLSTSSDEVDALQEEEDALAASRRSFRPVLESRLQERIDSIEATSSGPSCGHPECGATMGSKGQRTRDWQSGLGPITLQRRSSVCSEPGHSPGRSVAQEQLLLPAGRYTAGLSESLTMLATTVPHGMACQLASRLLGTEVSEHGMQDQVHDRATPLMAADEAEAFALNPFEDNGLEREVARPSDASAQRRTAAARRAGCHAEPAPRAPGSGRANSRAGLGPPDPHDGFPERFESRWTDDPPDYPRQALGRAVRQPGVGDNRWQGARCRCKSGEKDQPLTADYFDNVILCSERVRDPRNREKSALMLQNAGHGPAESLTEPAESLTGKAFMPM